MFLLITGTGTIVRDTNSIAIIIQKLLARICPREIHNLLIKPPADGGFEGARDNEGNVLISKMSMHRRWPNWIVKMTKRFKAMCVCDKCGVPTEVQDSVNIKRRKYSRSFNLMWGVWWVDEQRLLIFSV